MRSGLSSKLPYYVSCIPLYSLLSLTPKGGGVIRMGILGDLLRTLPTTDGDSSNYPHPPFQGHYCFLKWEFYCKVSIIIPIKYLFFTLVLFKKQITQSSLLVLEFICLVFIKKKIFSICPQFLPLLFNITSIPTGLSSLLYLLPHSISRSQCLLSCDSQDLSSHLDCSWHELNCSVSFERKWVMMVVVQNGNAKIKYRKNYIMRYQHNFFSLTCKLNLRHVIWKLFKVLLFLWLCDLELILFLADTGC